VFDLDFSLFLSFLAFLKVGILCESLKLVNVWGFIFIFGDQSNEKYFHEGEKALLRRQVLFN